MRRVFYLETAGLAGSISLREDAQLIRRGKRWIEIADKRIKLPNDRTDIGEAIINNTIGHWIQVLDDMADLIGSHDLCVLAFEDPLRELFQLGARLGRLRYALFFGEQPRRVYARDYELIGTAERLMFSSSEVEDGFRQSYVLHYYAAPIEDACSSASLPISHVRARDKGMSGASDDTIRVLLVGYYSGPSRTVGVKRINYWLDMLEPVSSGTIDVSLATATKWDVLSENVHLIPDWGPSILVDPDCGAPKWAAPFVEQERLNARSFSTLSYYWRIALEQYFDSRCDIFDVVIITGNPFSVFDFAMYAKRRWSARVILDYRDPFANNPRIAYKAEARDWARYIERGYNLQADAITVVNSDCISMIEGGDDVPVAVIANGYDERDMPDPLPRLRERDGKIHFVHAGSIFHDRSPKALIGALSPNQHQLHHIGSLAGLQEDDLKAPQVKLHGIKDYPDVLRLISSADCGIVFVSEKGFETPTKLYDYLAYGLDILIITHGPLYEGAVARTLSELPGVYWAPNNPEGLRQFVLSYKPSDLRRSKGERRRFSRRASAEKLVSIIQGLVSGKFSEEITSSDRPLISCLTSDLPSL